MYDLVFLSIATDLVLDTSAGQMTFSRGATAIMSQFLKWLVETAHSDTRIEKLADLAKKNPDAWKAVTNEPEARKAIEDDQTLSKDERREFSQNCVLCVVVLQSAFRSRHRSSEAPSRGKVRGG